MCLCLCARPAWPLAPPGWGCGAGVCGWAWVAAVPRDSWLECWGVCVFVCAPRLYPAFPGGVPVLPLVGLAPLPPPPLFFRGAMWCRSLVAPVLGLVVSVPPSLLFRAALFVFLFFRVACVRVFWVSLLPVGRCPRLGVAGFGWVVPQRPFGGPVFGSGWVGGLAVSCGVGGRCGGCGPISPPPPLFFLGGGVCLFLPLCLPCLPCLPWAGARTGRHSVWLSALLLVVAFCQAVPRPHGSAGLCTRWARCPFLPG